MKTTADHYLQIDLRGAFSPADVPTPQLRPVFGIECVTALLDKEAA